MIERIRPAFTLIELLVVVAILGILAGLLFPVFARTRENGRRTSCQANLKSITLAFKQYTQDFDETYPRSDVPGVGSLQSGSQTINHWVMALYPYSKSVQIFQCPSEPTALGTDFYYNSMIAGEKDSEFKYSANSVLLCEGVDQSLCNFAVAVAPVTSGTPMAYARHLDGSNYAFVDGHVKWLQYDRAPSPPTGAASNGGFTFGT